MGGIFIPILGLPESLPLQAQEVLLPAYEESFSPWSRPKNATLFFAKTYSLPFLAKIPFLARENFLGIENFLLQDDFRGDMRLFWVAQTGSTIPADQNAPGSVAGGAPGTLLAPANSPTFQNAPSSTGPQLQPALPSATSEPGTILIEPTMPGFEYQGVEAYLSDSLPPPAGRNPAGWEWLSDRSREWLLRNLLVFFGVHGFKGPADLGHSGNFGFHEGVNWAAPLWEPWGWGIQLGMEALHSNFLGTEAVDVGFGPPLQMADRNQIFFTGAVFQRRMEKGLQGGVAFDLFYDHYYQNTTLCQIRSETSLVLNPYHELGYWGAYAVSRESVQGVGSADAMIRPNDLFALFYRRRFTGGGMGRIWTGLSSYGDLVLGLEGTVPLGTQWAIDNNFTCLFPKHGRSSGDRPEEAWSVSIHLVWYPGRVSNPVVSNAYHPLFYVADNSWFLVKRRP